MSFKVIINRQVRSFNVVITRQTRSFVIRTAGVKWHSSTYTPDELNATLVASTTSEIVDGDFIVLTGKKKTLASTIKAYVLSGLIEVYAAINHSHSYANLSGLPSIPSIAGLVRDTRKVNNKALDADVSLDASDISETLTLKWLTDIERSKLAAIAAGAEVNVSPDWNAIDGDGFILNKPTIPTAPSQVGAEPASPNIQSHISSSSLHVAAGEKSTWNGKQDALGFTPEVTGVAQSLITQLINGAATGYDTLKELEDRIVAINAIIGGDTPDGDTIVNKVSELLAVFSTFEEGSNMVTLLTAKLNTSDVYNALDQLLAGKTLDARQGKVLNDLCSGLRTDLTNHNHAGVYEPSFSKNTAFNKNFGSTSGTVVQGDDVRLGDSRPASDVYAWAKGATKPVYNAGDVGTYTKAEIDLVMGAKQDKLSFPEIPTGKVLSDDGTFKEIASSPELSMTPTYYPDGSLHTTTTSGGTKTFSWNPDGTIAGIVGTGIYKSKTFNYVNGTFAGVTVL